MGITAGQSTFSRRPASDVGCLSGARGGRADSQRPSRHTPKGRTLAVDNFSGANFRSLCDDVRGPATSTGDDGAMDRRDDACATAKAAQVGRRVERGIGVDVRIGQEDGSITRHGRTVEVSGPDTSFSPIPASAEIVRRAERGLGLAIQRPRPAKGVPVEPPATSPGEWIKPGVPTETAETGQPAAPNASGTSVHLSALHRASPPLRTGCCRRDAHNCDYVKYHRGLSSTLVARQAFGSRPSNPLYIPEALCVIPYPPMFAPNTGISNHLTSAAC